MSIRYTVRQSSSFFGSLDHLPMQEVASVRGPWKNDCFHTTESGDFYVIKLKTDELWHVIRWNGLLDYQVYPSAGDVEDNIQYAALLAASQ